MKIFSSGDREWSLTIDLGAIGYLRQNAGFDFNAIARTDGAYREFLLGKNETPLLLAAWHLVRESGVSARDFRRSLDLDRLRDAFGREMAEFLPEADADQEGEKRKSKPDDHRGQWVERLGWQLAGICGVDGRRLTLRQLVWMAREHKRSTGELAAWHVSQIVARIPFGGATNLDPEKINPYGIQRPKSAELIALEKWKAEQAWKIRFTPDN